MIPRKTNDPNHWQDRAAQMRALALTIGEPRVATLMSDLAAHYDKLADSAAARHPIDGKTLPQRAISQRRKRMSIRR